MSVAKTKEEAEQELMKAQQEMAKKFCPMARRTCLRSCVCYEEGRVADKAGLNGSYIYYSPYCKHPFVEGSIVVNVEN